jgi:hypothetical protein
MMKAEIIRERWAKIVGSYADKNQRLAETNPGDRAIYQRAVLDACEMDEPQSSGELAQFSVKLASLLSGGGIPNQDLLAEIRAMIDPEHSL